MITFILLFVFFIIAVTCAFVAYSANNRKRAGQAEVPPATTQAPPQRRVGQM
jgi:cbb3-type cytochrome oxidase subunit 3